MLRLFLLQPGNVHCSRLLRLPVLNARPIPASLSVLFRNSQLEYSKICQIKKFELQSGAFKNASFQCAQLIFCTSFDLVFSTRCYLTYISGPIRSKQILILCRNLDWEKGTKHSSVITDKKVSSNQLNKWIWQQQRCP